MSACPRGSSIRKRRISSCCARSHARFSNTVPAGKGGKPASSTPAISWFGNSLGQVKLGSDQMSLQAERAGVAAARVKYTAQAQSWGIKAPKTSGGSSNFAITVFILGNSNES